MNNYKDCEEVANRIYDLCGDMDYIDYQDTKEQDIRDLSEAIYQLKAMAQNEYNANYWRTLWNALQML